MKKYGFLFLFLFAVKSFAQSIPAPEPVRTYDIQHIIINVSFDWGQKMVMGECTTTIVPLSDSFNGFEVDASAFNIEWIRDKYAKVLDYTYDGKKIKINLPAQLNITDTLTYTVKYTCKPQRGLYFVYPTELDPSLPYEIWTQGESSDNSSWFPVYDYPNDKTTSELFITVGDSLKTVSNGYLEASGSLNTGERIDHWVQDKPHSTYLIMLTAGNFDVVKNETSPVPVYSFVDNGKLSEGEYVFRNVPGMISVFNERFGRDYAWDNYKQVVVRNFIYGGMENTSATVLNERAYYTPDIEPDYTSEDLIAHELTHQWWGDLTTCRNWNELWLNESFADYGVALWKEKYFGESGKDEYDYYILREQDAAMRADSTIKRLPVWEGYGDITQNTYDKGASMIHSFRHVLGDEKFFDVLKTFLNDNEFKNVTTEDFIAAVNKTMNDGNDYRWMVDQWIYKAGYPEFNVDYSYDETRAVLNLKVKQVQKTDTLTPVFRVPVDVRIKTALEDKIERIEIMDEDEEFNIPVNSEPNLVQFDYGNKIMDKTYIYSYDEQFNSPDAIDRISVLRNQLLVFSDAGRENKGFVMRGENNKIILDIDQVWMNNIKSLIESDKFWGARVETAKYLNELIKTNSKDFEFQFPKNLTPYIILTEAYSKQTDPRVKREILKSLGSFKDKKSANFILKQIKNEKNTYIIADGISALANSLPPAEIYDAISPFMNMPSHRQLVAGAVIDALDTADNYINDNRIKEAVKSFAFGKNIESRIRTKAVTALLKYAKDENIKELAEKYIDFNYRSVKLGFIKILGASGDKSLINFLTGYRITITDETVLKAIDSALEKLNK